MASVPPPDTITPQSPPETPPIDPMPERPFTEPPEIAPDGPDIDRPDPAIPEFPDGPGSTPET